MYTPLVIVLLLTVVTEFSTALTECGPCEQVVINKAQDRKCVRKAQCCEDHGIQLACFVNPCLNFNTACPRAGHCIAAFCEEIGCKAFYYDEYYNPIPLDECEVKVLKIGDVPEGLISRARRFVDVLRSL